MIAFLTRTKKRIFLLALVAVLTICGVAFAAWLSTGTGPGSGKTGSLVGLTVSAGDVAQVGDPAIPGNPGDAVVTVNNPNGPLTIIGTESVPGNASAHPSCVTKIGSATQTGLNIPLPTGTTNVKIPNAFTVAADAPDVCQNIAFTKEIKLIAAAQ
jgi:hypothetical protein